MTHVPPVQMEALWRLARFMPGAARCLAGGLTSDDVIIRQFVTCGLVRLAGIDQKALRALRWALADKDTAVSSHAERLVQELLPAENRRAICAPGMSRADDLLATALQQRPVPIDEVHRLTEIRDILEWAEAKNPPHMAGMAAQLFHLFGLRSEADWREASESDDDRGEWSEAIGDEHPAAERRSSRPFMLPDHETDVVAALPFLSLDESNFQCWLHWSIAHFDPESRCALETALVNEESIVRRFAATAIGHMLMDDPSLIPVLARALEDADPTTAAIAALSLSGIESATSDLIGRAEVLLSGTSVELKRCAAMAFERLGSRAAVALPALTASLGRESEATILERLLGCLARCGPLAHGARARVLELLYHTEGQVQESALRAILRIELDDPPFSALELVLRRELRWMERATVEDVRSGTRGNLIAKLVSVVAHSTEPTARDLIEHAFKQGKSTKIRKAARDALREIGQSGSE